MRKGVVGMLKIVDEILATVNFIIGFGAFCGGQTNVGFVFILLTFIFLCDLFLDDRR